MSCSLWKSGLQTWLLSMMRLSLKWNLLLLWVYCPPVLLAPLKWRFASLFLLYLSLPVSYSNAPHPPNTCHVTSEWWKAVWTCTFALNQLRLYTDFTPSLSSFSLRRVHVSSQPDARSWHHSRCSLLYDCLICICHHTTLLSFLPWLLLRSTAGTSISEWGPPRGLCSSLPSRVGLCNSSFLKRCFKNITSRLKSF